MKKQVSNELRVSTRRQHDSHLATVAVLSGTLLMTASGAFAAVTEFSATVEHRFKPTQQIFGSSQILVSASRGYRVKELSGYSSETINHETIANLGTGQIWLVDTVRSLVHEETGTNDNESSVLPVSVLSVPGFINSTPCLGQQGEHTHDIEYQGKTLEVWACTPSAASPSLSINDEYGDENYFDNDDLDDDDPVVEQYFSRSLSLVLYARTRDGIETVVSDLTPLPSIDKALFMPPEGLRSVSYLQFMGWELPLSQYKEFIQQPE